MMGLYRAEASGNFADVALASGVGLASKTTLGFGCSFVDCDLDGSLQGCFVDLAVPSVLHVRVHVTVQPVLLALFRFPAFQAEADASSNPLQQE